MIVVNCIVCKKSFRVKDSRKNSAKYCSRICRAKFLNIDKKCAICDKVMHVKKSLVNRKKYCCKDCYHEGMKIKPAWNKGLGLYHTYKAKNLTVNGKNIIESHYIWTNIPGNPSHVPKGYVIHHIDLDHKNNAPENLKLMTVREHHKLHHVIFKKMKEGTWEH